jgi:hypothetical protein
MMAHTGILICPAAAPPLSCSARAVFSTDFVFPRQSAANLRSLDFCPPHAGWGGGSRGGGGRGKFGVGSITVQGGHLYLLFEHDLQGVASSTCRVAQVEG